MTYKPSEVGKGDLVFDQHSLVSLVYKSLCAAVTISGILVDIQTHTPAHRYSATSNSTETAESHLFMLYF